MHLGFFILSGVMVIVASAPARADDVIVYQEGKKFSEAEVTVRVGEAVAYTNKDPITHNVFSGTPRMSFDLKTQKPGASTTITFDRVGDAAVQCAIHPQMSMTVHVQ